MADDSIDWLIVFLVLVGMEVDDSLLGGGAISLLLGATSSSSVGGGGEGGGGGGGSGGGGVVMVCVSMIDVSCEADNGSGLIFRTK